MRDTSKDALVTVIEKLVATNGLSFASSIGDLVAVQKLVTLADAKQYSASKVSKKEWEAIQDRVVKQMVTPVLSAYQASSTSTESNSSHPTPKPM